ncbi:MAG: hypothetical protein QXR85_01605 [Candidatus Micrarchaeaceae archaeon]
MIPIVILIASLFIAAGAIVGMIFSRHFIIIMLAVEMLLIAAIVLLVSFFATSTNPSSSGIMLLFLIWAIAAAEAIVALAFYAFMKSRGISFDISKLNEMKW